jgi:RHS repeat-associated protein
MKANLLVLLRSSIALLLASAGWVHAQVPSNPYSYSRTSSFTYFGASDGAYAGLLKTETVEPDNVQACVTTGYTYDPYGNKNSVSIANCAGATGNAVFLTRSAGSTFAAQIVNVSGTSVSTPAGVFVTSSTNALSQGESKAYDPRSGAMLSLTGPNGLTTSWVVDDFGRKVKELRADGTSTVTAFCVLSSSGLSTASNSSTPNDPMNCPTPASGEAPSNAIVFVHSEPRDSAGAKSGPFVRVYSDRLGRELRTVTESFDGAGQTAGRSGVLVAKDTVYSQFGPKTLETQPYFLVSTSSTVGGSGDVGVTRIDYDALGRPKDIYVADVNGSQGGVDFGGYGNNHQAAHQSVTYAGLSTTTTNDKGQTRQEEKNANGELVRVTDASGAKLAHQRDAFGNLVETRDALQNKVQLFYDIRGRKTKMIDPDTGTWTYDYDALGQLVSQQSPNQLALSSTTKTTMVYDQLGRMTSRVEGYSTTYTSRWYYDKRQDGTYCMTGSVTAPGAGKLCESNIDNGVNRKFGYDNLGRPQSARTTITAGPSFATAVHYDSAGRIDSQTYPTGVQVGYGYTVRGFMEKLTLLTAATVNPLPNSQGQTASGTTLTVGTVLWQAKVVNAWGRTEQQVYGNGVTAQAVYEAATGRATDLTAGTSGTTTVLNQHYTWDSLNNLTGRIDNNGDRDISTGVSTGGVSETFNYDDSLNRLTNYTVSAPQIPGLSRTVNLQYNALGMLLYKSDVGNYTYPTQGGTSTHGPHALQSVAGSITANYVYDGNGNLTSASAGKYRTISYTSFNLPDSQNGIQGAAGTPKYTWSYDENHARIKEVRVDSTGTRTTWYAHPDNQGGLGFESETAASGAISNRHYLTAGGVSIGVLVSTGALPTLGATQMAPTVLSSVTLVKVEYWHKDQLGSLIATTDHLGNVTQRYAFDPFGKRRYTNGTYDEFGNIVADWSSSLNWGTDRGFTGQEELDDIGLVNLNGRIFDPTLGVFLQGDPFIQDPANLQNYNRYGYCLNNPLTCTDPTGFFSLRRFLGGAILSLILPGVGELIMLNEIAHSKIGYQVGSIVIGALSLYCGPAAPACAAAGEASWASMAGYSAEQSIRVGVFAAVSTYVNGQIGDGFKVGLNGEGAFSNTLAHGVWGCAESSMQGGSCGSGFRGGLAGAAMSNYGPGDIGDPRHDIGDLAVNTMIHSVIGGVASVAGGGNFAQGAQSAAFAYLFNALGDHSGAGPNQRHQIGVDQSIADDVARGFELVGREVPVLINGQVRVYDYVIRDTVENINIGVEVKTTIGETIRLDKRQVNLDVDLMRSSATGGSGGIMVSTGALVRGVSYRAYCFFCDTVDMRSIYMRQQLDLYGIWTQRGKLPGFYQPPRP